MFQEMVDAVGRAKRWGYGPRGKFPMPMGFDLFEPPLGTVASLESSEIGMSFINGIKQNHTPCYLFLI